MNQGIIEKHRIPPPFSTESARRCQRLSVRARRAMDNRLREELVKLIPVMGCSLRQSLVDALPIRTVERLRLAAMKAER